MAKRILIVDDDVEALRLIGLMLERKGYVIDAAATGEQALEKVTQALPDLIILDVMMPGMDGYRVAQHLRENPETADIPILFFTAKSSITDKLAGFQAGGDDYLTKPIHPAELVSRIEVLIQRGVRQAPEIARGKIIAFLPTKGGVGNSTLALNAALELATKHADKKTVLVELTAGGGTTALQLGSTPARTLQNLVEQGMNALTQQVVDSYLLGHPSGLRILASTSSPAGTAPAPTANFVQDLLHILLVDYDYVIFDLSAALHKANNEVLRRAHFIVLGMEPNKIGTQLAEAMLEELTRLNVGKYKIGLVLIYRAPAASAITRTQIQEQFNQELLASIPPVPDLAYESWASGRPMLSIQPMNLFSQQVRLIVNSILKLL